MKLGNFRHGQDCQFHHHTWGAIAGAAISVVGGAVNANQAKKGAGKVAQYANPDITDVQKQALDANLSNSGSIENLISQGNKFAGQQATSLQEQVMPGYTNLTKTLTSRAQTLAAHPYDVPQEVQDNLSRIAAEKGISAGTRGQFNDFSLLRDLGVNELQYGQQQISQAQSLTGVLAAIAPKVNPMSPLSFYVTPSQSLSNTTNNAAQNQAIAQGGINAQNAASAAGNADLWGSLGKIAGLYGSSITNGQQPSYNSDPGKVDTFAGIDPNAYKGP
jgi:hypothetical protein